jgi:hypothetical protein
MKNAHYEAFKQLEYVSAHAGIIAQELRQNPTQCWNLPMDVRSLITQLEKVAKAAEDINFRNIT